MCGIVGYVGPRPATPIVVGGLQRLEYRGYDSAGIAVLQNGRIEVRRDVGKLSNLINLLNQHPTNGHLAVGHTRWATHGKPSQQNAHPHSDATGEIVVVQNGIVENYRELRESLQAEGIEFRSETDTEVIVHLISLHYSAAGGLAEAVRRALGYLKGPSAIVAMTSREPDRLVAARLGNAGGVAIGLGDGETFIASDIPAILEHTRRMVFLEDRQYAAVTREGAQVFTLDGRPVQPQVHHIPWDPVSAAKGEYRHFMQKEIFEQARSITDTIRGRVDFDAGEVVLEDLILTPEQAARFNRIVIVACGTSAYAGLVGKFWFENIARLPVEVDYASEFRYRNPVVDDRTLLLAITQSGETVDTLAAMEEGRRRGAYLASIVNVIGSQAARVSDGVIYMRCGPEIGVASTKAFTASLVDQYLLAIYLAQQRGTLSPEQRRRLLDDLARLPDLVGRVLEEGGPYVELAERFHAYHNFLYLGRGINYPVALEGALKLKEISYIHAEGYPAGEMKHGPIALIDRNMPVVTIAVQDDVYDKMISQIEQVKARNGIVIALANEGDSFIGTKADHVIAVPKAPPLLSPVINVLPLQRLAYEIAVWRGADVDQPRNLAKSVTVE
ncbi:MAG: glutamine--fructose-6-phosphate transaminase (isomerizing) [Caldilineales bacterium]|nr:glutamine--fructose-6-phosphate transaminase (isomerizing) [Caldilineales bacterium]MDW8318930.1 glutamine--fructose-6-phosphate transaminase (isomerizing) [Anaerolineae bacterium]